MGTFVLDLREMVLYLASKSECQPAIIEQFIEQLVQKGADLNATGKLLLLLFYFRFRSRLNLVQTVPAEQLFTGHVTLEERALFHCFWLTAPSHISNVHMECSL
jgi:hypothetical protein